MFADICVEIPVCNLIMQRYAYDEPAGIEVSGKRTQERHIRTVGADRNAKAFFTCDTDKGDQIGMKRRLAAEHVDLFDSRTGKNIR